MPPGALVWQAIDMLFLLHIEVLHDVELPAGRRRLAARQRAGQGRACGRCSLYLLHGAVRAVTVADCRSAAGLCARRRRRGAQHVPVAGGDLRERACAGRAAAAGRRPPGRAGLRKHRNRGARGRRRRAPAPDLSDCVRTRACAAGMRPCRTANGLWSPPHCAGPVGRAFQRSS